MEQTGRDANKGARALGPPEVRRKQETLLSVLRTLAKRNETPQH